MGPKRHHKSYYEIKTEYSLQNYLRVEIWARQQQKHMEYRVYHVELIVQSSETVCVLCPCVYLVRYFLDVSISDQAVDFTRWLKLTVFGFIWQLQKALTSRKLLQTANIQLILPAGNTVPPPDVVL